MSKLKSIREIEMERATEPNFGKGITVASGFDLGAKAPLDSRLTVKTIEERDAHVTGNRSYEGMIVYVEADKNTYQLIDNVWVDKNTEQDQRLKTLEDLVVGGEGEGLESVISDVAANKAAIAKEITDRQAADTALDGKISALDAAYKNADIAINSRLDALEGATADLEQIRTDIESNTGAITKEVQDRTAAVSGVDSKITAEVTRATKAEEALSGRLDIIEGTEEVEGSIAKALTDAKAYTDAEVNKAKTSVTELEKKVTANTTALGLVDGKIATAKTEAVEAAKGYTDGEITKIDTAYKAADTKVLSDAKSYTDTKVNEAKTALEGSISNLEGKVSTNESGIAEVKEDLKTQMGAARAEMQEIKNAISNKNSNTVVVETEAEIATSNPNPKVGDLAFVISSKRAYIYKGVEAVTAKNAPEGWVVFDEITNELDLVDYLKKTDAEATYRKKTDKIAEGDLATELATKINNKADKSYVDGELAKKTNEAYVNSKVEEVVSPVRTESAANKAAIAKEVTDRQGEITRVEGLVTTETENRETAVSAVDSKVNSVTQRFNKFVPVVASTQPEGTETGHVWLEIQA